MLCTALCVMILQEVCIFPSYKIKGHVDKPFKQRFCNKIKAKSGTGKGRISVQYLISNTCYCHM